MKYYNYEGSKVTIDYDPYKLDRATYKYCVKVTCCGCEDVGYWDFLFTSHIQAVDFIEFVISLDKEEFRISDLVKEFNGKYKVAHPSVATMAKY